MLYDITNNSVVSLFALVLRSHYIAGLVQLFEDGILKAPFSLMMMIIMWLPDRRSTRRHAVGGYTTAEAALLAQAAWCSVVQDLPKRFTNLRVMDSSGPQNEKQLSYRKQKKLLGI